MLKENSSGCPQASSPTCESSQSAALQHLVSCKFVLPMNHLLVIDHMENTLFIYFSCANTLFPAFLWAVLWLILSSASENPKRKM